LPAYCEFQTLEVNMATAVTNARWESSHRGRGVTFDAESEQGRGEFLVAEEALADLARGQNMTSDECVEAFESHADEISEAAGRCIAARRARRGELVILTAEDLPSIQSPRP
jgi:hypothetical protein